MKILEINKLTIAKSLKKAKVGSVPQPSANVGLGGKEYS
jgi:hypothetical protein